MNHWSIQVNGKCLVLMTYSVNAVIGHRARLQVLMGGQSVWHFTPPTDFGFAYSARVKLNRVLESRVIRIYRDDVERTYKFQL